MAKEFDSKKMDALVKQLKKDANQSTTFYASEVGIPQSEILRYLLVAELTADPSLKIPATPAGILKAKKSGLRWPRVAARAGVSVSKAKELFVQAGGTEEDEYTGRGRKSFGAGATATSGSSAGATRRGGAASKSASKKTTATSGRRSSKSTSKTTAAPATRRPGRRTTRAAANTAADPK